MAKLSEMVSDTAYDEIITKAKSAVGENAAEFIIPSIIKALEDGGGGVREDILIGWLDCEHVRVCSTCGKIMEEGWYMDCAGYACSDECAAASDGISMENFAKWRIYKDDIEAYLESEGNGRKIEDLSQEECDTIIESECQDRDYYYTEWY